MSEPFIKAENLTFSYTDEMSGDQKVLAGVSFEIQKGEYVAIVGHNGSGKSTLAKLMNAILEPQGGRLIVAGKDLSSPMLTEEDVFALRREVGMVFQNPDNQLVATIVEEDIAFGPENLGIPSKEIRARVDEALEIVGMTQYARHEPHRLSGGQKQRVAIAGLIAMRPSCMIFDESTAMLDPRGRREVVETFEKLNREKGITILTITHYMNEAARADRVIVLDDGKILADGTPREVFAKVELLTSVGLDVPQCTALAHTLQGKGVLPRGHVVITEEECAEMICSALKERQNGDRNA